MLVWLYVSVKKTMEFYFWFFENIKLDTVLNKHNHTYPSNMIMVSVSNGMFFTRLICSILFLLLRKHQLYYVVKMMKKCRDT